MPTAQADHAGDVVAWADISREGLAHRGNRHAAIVTAEHELHAPRMTRGDFGCGNVDRNLGRSCADVYEQRGSACRFDQRFDVLKLRAFGIRRADDVHALHGVV